MNKENDIVYVKTKNGIYKCYKSEQMHKPIYYPVESKTNGYIDYNDVIDILSSDDLYNELKKQKEVIDNSIEYIKEKQKIQYKFALSHIECDDLLEILENKEVSE